MDIGAELKGKAGPLPLYAWLLIMTGVGVGAYLLLKKKKGPGTGTPGTACTQSDGSAGTWDSTGTVCQASTVSTVNAPAAATAAMSTPDATAATVPPSGVPITTGTGSGFPWPGGGSNFPGSTGTGNPNAGNWSFPAPGGLKVTGAGKNSTQIKISWSAVKGPGGQTPASYEVRVFRGGAQIRENAVAGTSYTESLTRS